MVSKKSLSRTNFNGHVLVNKDKLYHALNILLKYIYRGFFFFFKIVHWFHQQKKDSLTNAMIPLQPERLFETYLFICVNFL